MKKIVLVLLIIISVFPNVAFANSMGIEKSKIDSLEIKVAELEHTLEYLEVSSNLHNLISSITSPSNNAEIQLLNMKIDCFHHNYDRAVWSMYQELYDSFVNQQQSIADLIEVQKSYILLKLLTYPFTADEKDVLLSCFDTIEKAFIVFDQTLTNIKGILDLYKEMQ